MNIQSTTPVLNVSDVAASLAWFEALGWQRNFTWNDAGHIAAAGDSNAAGPANFAGICCGTSEMFLCRDGQGGRGEHGMWISWWLGDRAEVDAAHDMAREQHVEVLRAPADEPWGVRECLLRHPDGHTFRVSAGLQT